MWALSEGKIHKTIIAEGVWGKKPSEHSECEVLISECPDTFQEYNNTKLVVGNADNYVRRTLDLCLVSMNEGEVAKFTQDDISFTISLTRVNFRGWIYQWNAKRKLEIAQNHKDKGVELFKLNQNKDAAYRFSKALKILNSIPIDVEAVPEFIDAVPVGEINTLKGVLYNNLASYYLKRGAWVFTIDACKKALIFDKDNVKAHYKLAVAFMNDRDFERAEEELKVVLLKEPNNKAAGEHMKHIKTEIRKANDRVDSLFKKMFV